jgi:hypothetical protein
VHRANHRSVNFRGTRRAAVGLALVAMCGSLAIAASAVAAPATAGSTRYAGGGRTGTGAVAGLAGLTFHTTAVPGPNVDGAHTDNGSEPHGPRWSGLMSASRNDPDPAAACGLKIALFLDSPGSIASNAVRLTYDPAAHDSTSRYATAFDLSDAGQPRGGSTVESAASAPVGAAEAGDVSTQRPADPSGVGGVGVSGDGGGVLAQTGVTVAELGILAMLILGIGGLLMLGGRRPGAGE